jgi:hypothetical protein
MNVNDGVPGALSVRKDGESYFVSYNPHDYGRGGLGEIRMTDGELLRFFDEIRLRPAARVDAVRDLQLQNGCRLPDLHTSRAILVRLRLID